MSFLWKDDSTSDGPPEKTRRMVQAQVEAHFAKSTAKTWKPGPAARALDRAIRSLPEGAEDVRALSPRQRFRVEALRAEALREHQEFIRRATADRTTRTGRTKKHSSLVRVPRCLTPPYTTSVIFTTPNLGSGFGEHDGELPQQPNGQSILADKVNGVAGHTMVWNHESGDTAFLEVTRGVLIGGWIQADYTTPPILDAHLTAFSFTPPDMGNGGVTDGWIYLFGGGIAAYQLFTKVFVFTATSQTGNPPAPVMTAATPVVDVNFSTLQVFRYAIPAGTRKAVAGTASGVGRGTWMLVLAGPVARFMASVWHADWSMGVDTTWSVDQICCYW